MGGFSPVATVAIGLPLLAHNMSGEQLAGFAFMTAGGFLMFFSENLPVKRLILPVLLASGLLGLVNVLSKVVYDQTNFVTGYVWFTIGTFVGALALLVPAPWRRQIFETSEETKPRSRFWYFVNRFVDGVGSFLVFYAISLTHPALVDAIAGVRYVVIFLGALLLTKLRPLWLREDFRGWQLVTKTAATALVVAGLVIVGLSGGHQANAGGATAAATVRENSAGPERGLLGVVELGGAPGLFPDDVVDVAEDLFKHGLPVRPVAADGSARRRACEVVSGSPDRVRQADRRESYIDRAEHTSAGHSPNVRQSIPSSAAVLHSPSRRSEWWSYRGGSGRTPARRARSSSETRRSWQPSSTAARIDALSGEQSCHSSGRAMAWAIRSRSPSSRPSAHAHRRASVARWTAVTGRVAARSS